MTRTAVVTGASRGIGAASAIELARRGHRVVVNHRDNDEEAERVVASICALGGDAVSIRADVSQPDDVVALVADTESLWGGVDVLVHDVPAPYEPTSFVDLDWEQLQDSLNREVRSAFLLTKAVIPAMMQHNGGRLVYLSSVPARHSRAGRVAHGLAEAAMDQFVQYVATELAIHGVTANLVAMGRSVTPDEVAKTVAFFAGDDAGFISGHRVPVNGGLDLD